MLFLTTTYPALLQVAAGQISFEAFVSDHAKVDAPNDAAKAVFLARIEAAMMGVAYRSSAHAHTLT